MEEYEEKLHFARLAAESSLAQSLRTEELMRWAQSLPAEKRLEAEAILSKDYSAEVGRTLADGKAL